jgi:hypothetical protein
MAGLETHRIGGMPLKIYSAARTVVDCFKFRNKLGLEVPLEALRLARQRKRVQNRELLHHAAASCRKSHVTVPAGKRGGMRRGSWARWVRVRRPTVLPQVRVARAEFPAWASTPTLCLINHTSPPNDAAVCPAGVV